jgi:hypothetical protein
MVERPTPEPARGADGASYLTLTGSALSFVFWTAVGRLAWGADGMCVGAALVALWYCAAIWRAAYPPADPQASEATGEQAERRSPPAG